MPLAAVSLWSQPSPSELVHSFCPALDSGLGYGNNQGSSHRREGMTSGNKETGPNLVNKGQGPRSKQAIGTIVHAKSIISMVCNQGGNPGFFKGTRS